MAKEKRSQIKAEEVTAAELGFKAASVAAAPLYHLYQRCSVNHSLGFSLFFFFCIPV